MLWLAIAGRDVPSASNSSIRSGPASSPEAQQRLKSGLRCPPTVVPKNEFIKVDRKLRFADAVVRAGQPLLQVPDGAINQPQKKKRIRSELVQFTKDTVRSSPALTGLALTLGDTFDVKAYRSPAAYLFMREWTESEHEFLDERLSILADIRDRARSADKRLGVVIIPNKIQVENSDALTGKHYDREKPNRLILDFWAGNGLERLDLLPALTKQFTKSGDQLYYPRDRHFNLQGSRFVASEIFRWLKDTGLTTRQRQ